MSKDSNEPNHPVKCDNCEWMGKELDTGGLAGVHHLYTRLEPGGEVPAGQCPKCRSLVYLDRPDPADIVERFGVSVGIWRDHYESEANKKIVESDDIAGTAYSHVVGGLTSVTEKLRLNDYAGAMEGSLEIR